MLKDNEYILLKNQDEQFSSKQRAYSIDRAIKFAARAHNGQFRKGSDIPYISHPLAIALLLQEAGATTEQIIAGILHDTVEDTDVTLKEIEEKFGKKVAALVEACSEYDSSAAWENRKNHTINFLRTASPEIKLITCADKLHNLRSIAEDYEVLGESLWKKFGRGKEFQAWYYYNLVDVLCCGLDGQSSFADMPRAALLFNQFRAEVKALFEDKLTVNRAACPLELNFGSNK